MYEMKRKLQLSGGNKCFINCPGCYNFFSKGDYNTENLLNFLFEMKLKTNIKKVTMSGGDPLVREDISDILKIINIMGLKSNLDTVGLSFVKDIEIGKGKKMQTIKKVDTKTIINSVKNIGIPLDGSTDVIINMFRRGLKKDSIIEVIKEISKYNARICINTVVHSGNIIDIINIYKILVEFPCVVKWQLFQFIPSGPSGATNASKFIISNEDFYELKGYLSTLNSPFAIECKSIADREDNYLLIDGSGNIWVPESPNLDSKSYLLNKKRLILGNIRDKNIVDGLIYQLILIDDSPMNQSRVI